MADVSGSHLTGSAPERYEQYTAPIMAPFVTALLDAAALSPGETVLDLACGTGFVARTAAARVGPAGHVCGTDPDAAMLQVAAAHRPRHYPDIEFTTAPADRLPFPDATFDAVLCQQGFRSLPDPAAALHEAARVTRPAGRLAATAWAGHTRSPYLSAQYAALARHGGQALADSLDAALSRPAEHLAAALRSAGFRDVTTREITADVTLPPLPGFAPAQFSSTPWGRRLADEHGTEALTAAGRTVTDLLAGHTAPGGAVTVPFTATLATAHR
ncbi:MAG TPA: methyltransferase domain-containing protein [Streptomyces sp.]|nr:methyltransferase domain-containing protein [Streptomyces sp.]